MTIRRGMVPAVDHFTVVPNDWLRDDNLSFRARGLLAYLLSHREGWSISGVRDLARHGTEGRDAMATALKELEEHGYIERERARDEGGRLRQTDYVIGATSWKSANEGGPKVPSQQVSASDGFPGAGSPGPGNPTTKKTSSSEDQDEKNISSSSKGARARAQAPRPRRAQQQKMLMTKDWTPSPETMAWARAERPDISIGMTLGKFIQYRIEKRHRSADWDSDFRDWVDREHADEDHIDLTDQPEEPTAKGGPGRPEWCGDCDERTRLWESSAGAMIRCSYCHPLVAGAI